MTTTLDQSIVRETMLAPLQEQSIRNHLKKLNMNDIGKIHIFSSIDSTNDYLLEYGSMGVQTTVCLAEQQMQGRGRYGHQWVSPPGVNLYLSMSWPVSDELQQYDVLCLWLLLAVVELLEANQFKNIRLKWPNDICVLNKKLAGILIERKVGKDKSNLIVGLGLNVAMSLKENMQIGAPWIDLLSIKPDWHISRNELSAKLISTFSETLAKFEQSRLCDLAVRWNQYDMLKDKNVEFQLGKVSKTGNVKGIDELGRIIIEIDNKQMQLHSSQASEIKLTGISR